MDCRVNRAFAPGNEAPARYAASEDGIASTA
jgi:hypothetical protein